MENDNPYQTNSTLPLGNMPSPQPNQHSDSYARWRLVAALFVAVIGGALVWGLSLALTGEMEPWDSASYYYGTGIGVASAISGLLAGRQFWLPILGTYVGQVTYCVLFYQPGGPVIMPIAISAGLFGIVPSAIGAGIGAMFRELFRKTFLSLHGHRGSTS